MDRFPHCRRSQQREALAAALRNAYDEALKEWLDGPRYGTARLTEWSIESPDQLIMEDLKWAGDHCRVAQKRARLATDYVRGIVLHAIAEGFDLEAGAEVAGLDPTTVRQWLVDGNL